MKRYILFLFFLMLAAVVQAAPLKVASTHPLLTDMATVLGGKRVKIVNLFPEEFDLHSYAPDSGEISKALGSKIVLLCGKGIEARYIDTLKESFSGRTVLLELGKDIPDVTITPESDKIDPHWWNNPENMKLAATKLAAELTKADPAGKAEYAAGLEKYSKSMDALMTKTRAKMSRLPEYRRLVVTSHPGMAHFCKAFGLTPCPINNKPDADIDAMVEDLKAKGVVCMFFDLFDPMDVFDSVAEKAGFRTEPLMMDGIYSSMKTYSVLFSINVASLYRSLRDKEAEAAMDAKNRAARFEEIKSRYEASKQQGASDKETPAPAGK